MDALHVPLTAAAVLLVAAGGRKLGWPRDAARALQLTGLPTPPALVRVLGGAELVVGVGVIVAGDRAPWPFALGVLYAGFAMFVALALWRRAPLSSCGCFGSAGVTPTPLHAGVDAGAAAIGFVAAVEPIDAPVTVLWDGGASAVGLVAGAAVLALAGYLLFTRWRGSRATSSPPDPR